MNAALSAIMRVRTRFPIHRHLFPENREISHREANSARIPGVSRPGCLLRRRTGTFFRTELRFVSNRRFWRSGCGGLQGKYRENSRLRGQASRRNMLSSRLNVGLMGHGASNLTVKIFIKSREIARAITLFQSRRSQLALANR